MDKILLALGGVALGVAAYTLGEIVQEKRAQKGEEYGVSDLLDEWIDELGGSQRAYAKEKSEEQ